MKIRNKIIISALVFFFAVNAIVPNTLFAQTPIPNSPASTENTGEKTNDLEFSEEKAESGEEKTSLLPTDLILPGLNNGASSASQRGDLEIIAMKETLSPDETQKITIVSAESENLSVKLFDGDGEKVKTKINIAQQNGLSIASIPPSNQFRPGVYHVQVENPETGEKITQDFTWGVLALNLSKSVYSPGETADVAIAVLDESGEMICDADVKLKVIDPSGKTKEFTTSEGIIISTPQCLSKKFSLMPDYQTSFKVGDAGVYKMTLSAITKNGSYSISDSFKVSESISFDIERSGPTRIYPPHNYPVKMKITANQDFDGIVKETVPASFKISKLEGLKSFSSITNPDTKWESIYPAPLYDLRFPFDGAPNVILSFGEKSKDSLMGEKFARYRVAGNDGVDFALAKGSKVVAAGDGKVVRSEDSDYGNTIVIEHSWGKSYYGYLDKFIAISGKKVKKGEVIALSGNSGIESEPQLHFAIKPNKHDMENGFYGKVNPLQFLNLPEKKLKHGQVAGEPLPKQSELKLGVQIISWNVSIKKGEEITIGYQFLAPEVSPEFYLLGPLTFEEDGQKIFAEERNWQIAADVVVVSGGIVSAEAQFGGLQRKVAYVNSNWYAFYNDGTDVWYKKSADGVTWGSAVDMDSSDADNYNPSIDVSGNFILVAWIDNSLDAIEIKSIDTGSSDTLTGLCASADQGTIDTDSFMISIAALSTTSAVVSYSDTSADTEVDIFEVTAITGGTCTPTYTDVNPGAITLGTQGPGIYSGYRPVLVGLSATSVMVIGQTGSELRSSVFDVSRDEWRQNMHVIAAISDSTYSATTDGTNVWVLTQNGTTATRLYHYSVASTGINVTSTAIDTDVGGAAADMQDTNVDMYCPTSDATNCKIIYVDDLDTAAPVLHFVDCSAADCSTNTNKNVDSDIGSATVIGKLSLDCPTTSSCKIFYGDIATAPDTIFVDCPDETCGTSDTPGTCASGGRTCTNINTDYGANTTVFRGDIYCLSDTDCQVIYFDDDAAGGGDLMLADCNDATCSSPTSNAVIVAGINTTNSNAEMSLWCPASGNCKVLFHDAVNGDLTLRDCQNTACSAADATTDIDADVGTTGVNVPSDIYCVAATNCQILYADGSQNEVNFVRCDSDEDCSTNTTRKIDDTAGGLVTHSVSLQCLTNSTCRGTFVGNTAGGSEQVYVLACSDSACDTSGGESVMELSSPPTRADISCVSASDCKIVYYDAFVGAADAPVKFADCTNNSCTPDWESLTAPWTSETSVASISLTYDSSGTDLIANIVKDATNQQAYYNTTDVSSISWTGSTAYEFTAGAMDNMSSPESAVGTAQMGVLVRLGTNMEFDLFACAGCGPTLDQLMRHGKWFNGSSEQPFTF